MTVGKSIVLDIVGVKQSGEDVNIAGEVTAASQDGNVVSVERVDGNTFKVTGVGSGSYNVTFTSGEFACVHSGTVEEADPVVGIKVVEVPE